MDFQLAIVVLLVGLALVFDYINGFHDAANSIATVVSTRVLSRGRRWCGRRFRRRLRVRHGAQDGRVRHDYNVVTFAVTRLGWSARLSGTRSPGTTDCRLSSSHALFGGYAGAAVTKGGFGSIIVAGWTKTLVFIVVAPWSASSSGSMVAFLLDLPAHVAHARRQGVPQAAARVGSRLQPDARRQRRPEDDGHHRRRALHGRLPAGVHDRFWVVIAVPLAWGRCPGGGASSTRWGRRLPS